MSQKKQSTGGTSNLGDDAGRRAERKDASQLETQPNESNPSVAEELMREVRRRVQLRRSSGLLSEDDDSLPFASEALKDDLAAAANRVFVAARISGFVPQFLLPAPHDEVERTDVAARIASFSDKDGDDSRPSEGSAKSLDSCVEAIPDSQDTPSPSRVILRAAASAGRKVFRAIAGDRIDRFIDESIEFFFASAAFAREAAERVLALERRVEELEKAVSGLREPEGQRADGPVAAVQNKGLLTRNKTRRAIDGSQIESAEGTKVVEQHPVSPNPSMSRKRRGGK